MEFQVLQAIQSLRTPFLDSIMVFFSTIGDVGMVWIFLSIVLLCTKKHRICGITMLLALFLGFLTANVFLKNIITRERPCWIDSKVTLLVVTPKDFSFPSAHTVSSFAAAFSFYLYQKKAGVVAGVIASFIAFSRLYLYVHFPSDVIAGLIIGIVMAILAKKLVVSLQKRKRSI